MKLKLSLLLFLPFFVFANNHNSACEHNGETIPVGESIWVLDPILVERATTTMREKGYSQEQIDKRISRDDWVGYRLVCVNTYKENKGTLPKDILEQTGVALILNEYSRDFYTHIKNAKTNF